MTYYKPQLVAASQTKQISLPFNGLYHSYLGELLFDELDTATDEHCLDTGSAVFDFVYSLDLRQYHKALTNGYAEYLINELNDYHSLSIKISDVNYEPMNGMNRGDALCCDIDVTTLPAIPLAELQPYATDSLTSHSGFSSFYDPNLQGLQGAKLANWNDVYVKLVIEYLANDMGGAHDIEQGYIEELSGSGGAIELLMNNITDEQCATLNDLLYKDQDNV